MGSVCSCVFPPKSMLPATRRGHVKYKQTVHGTLITTTHVVSDDDTATSHDAKQQQLHPAASACTALAAIVNSAPASVPVTSTAPSVPLVPPIPCPPTSPLDGIIGGGGHDAVVHFSALSVQQPQSKPAPVSTPRQHLDVSARGAASTSTQPPSAPDSARIVTQQRDVHADAHLAAQSNRIQ